MKKSMVLLSAAMMALGFGLSSIVHGDSIPANIAVVDVSSVVDNSSQVKAYKKEYQQKKQEIANWLKTANADIEKQQTKEGKEKLAKKYKAEFSKKQEANAKALKEKLQVIDKNVSQAIAQEAKNGGYTVVLAKSSVLYGGADITPLVAKAVK